jgi:hypothetical protein
MSWPVKRMTSWSSARLWGVVRRAGHQTWRRESPRWPLSVDTPAGGASFDLSAPDGGVHEGQWQASNDSDSGQFLWIDTDGQPKCQFKSDALTVYYWAASNWFAARSAELP